jgi:hypothetical protein
VPARSATSRLPRSACSHSSVRCAGEIGERTTCGFRCARRGAVALSSRASPTLRVTFACRSATRNTEHSSVHRAHYIHSHRAATSPGRRRWRPPTSSPP